MEKLTLRRVVAGQSGTFGVLVRGTLPLCVTLENPWQDNKPNISCIPPGTYTCVRHNGAKYVNVWRLENVPERNAILIHMGNSVKDTQGCILVGRSFKEGWITSSLDALNYLRDTLPASFQLEVVNP